jgi:hypothetical protein
MTLTLSAFDQLDRRFIDAVQPSERPDRGVLAFLLAASAARNPALNLHF